MTAPDLAARLAALSPEKRALLERTLAQRGGVRVGDAAGAGVDDARPYPRQDAGSAPLSDAQHLLWLAEQMHPADAAYNVPIARRLRGTIDVPALERALTAVVAAHEAFRTTFVEENGEPVQRIGAPWNVRVAVVDLTDGADADDETADALRNAAAAPFDLGAGRLLRVLVVRRAEDSILLIVVHHLVFDGASIDLLLRDLTAAYDAASRGEDPCVAPPGLQPADLALWDRSAGRQATIARSAEYWRDYLEGASPEVDLVPDQDPGMRPTAARASIELPASLLAAIERTATGFGATTFMVLLAAFEAILYRYTRQDDVLIGVPVAARTHPDAAGTIGHLTDTVLVRARVSADTPFDALLSRTRDDFLHALEHEAGAAAALRGMSETESPATSGPRVLFGLQPTRGRGAAMGGVVLEPMATIGGGAKFLLSVNAAQASDRIRLTAEFSADRYTERFIAGMLSHFARFLEAVVADPQSRVGDVAIMTADEREQLLAASSGATVAYPDTTLDALIREQVARTPDAIAVEDERRTLTFAELDAAANTLATNLCTAGAHAGTLVAVCAERSVELVVALVATMRTGAAYVPLDPQYPAERLAFMLDDASPAVVISTSALANRTTTLDAAERVVLRVDAVEPLLAVSSPYRGAGPTPVDAAYMIYTSGSTGRPKGALNAHRGIVNRLLWMQDAYAVTTSDVVLQKTPTSFDVSVWELFLPLITGARLVLARPGAHGDTRHLVDVITRNAVTVCHFVPSMLRAFLADPDAARCTSLRDVIASGEALPPDLVAEFYRVLPRARLHNLYGPTECAVDVTAWACAPCDTIPAVVPIGKPVANTRMYVLDDALAPLPIAVPGELYIGGTQVGLGYHARPELTAARFVADPFSSAPAARMYRTGDRARWRADGTLEYLGRLDDQVKLRGFRIELGEIESALMAHPAVEQAIVVLRDLPRGDTAVEPTLVGFYVPSRDMVPRSDTDISDLEVDLALRVHLRASLPAHMIPALLVPVPSIPLTPSGKADRRALGKRPLPQAAAAFGTPPRTVVERAVADVWGVVLGRPVSDVEAGFLDLGGHSLLATRVVTQVARVFGVNLPLRTFFDRPTVAGHAAALLAADAVPGRTERIAEVYLKARSATSAPPVSSYAPSGQSPLPAGTPS